MYGRRTILKGVGIVGVTSLFSGAAVGAQGARQTGKYMLERSASITREPGVRPVNHVVEIETNEDGESGSVGRYLDVDDLPELEGLLGLDAKIVTGDSIASAPRIILSVDMTGDGEHDEWIFGFHTDLQAGIAGDGWVSIDFTDAGARWNASRIGGPGTWKPWTQVRDAWDDDFGLRTGWVVDDGWWKASAAGIIHLDNVQIGNRVLDGPEDTVGPNQ